MEKYVTVEKMAFKWHVEDFTVKKWCEGNKIKAIFKDDSWLVAVNQDCPLISYNDFLVYCTDTAAEEFQYDNVSMIFYDKVGVFTNLLFEEDGFRLDEDTFVVLYKTEEQQTITEYELSLICYHCYLLNYYKETGIYPIFLKYFWGIGQNSISTQ